MRKYIQKKGFSLIEIVIVVVVTSIILPMMMMIVGGMARHTTKANQITIATDLAREITELILAKRFDEKQPAAPSTPSADWTAAASLGSDSEARAAYDDMDDFNGLSETPVSGFPGYNRSVSVVYVAPPDHATTSGSPTNYKRITVNVTHNEIGTVTLTTLSGGWGN